MAITLSWAAPHIILAQAVFIAIWVELIIASVLYFAIAMRCGYRIASLNVAIAYAFAGLTQLQPWLMPNLFKPNHFLSSIVAANLFIAWNMGLVVLAKKTGTWLPDRLKAEERAREWEKAQKADAEWEERDRRHKEILARCCIDRRPDPRLEHLLKLAAAHSLPTSEKCSDGGLGTHAEAN
jgi:hypothetical protein